MEMTVETQVQKAPAAKTLTAKLKEEAAKNKVFNDVCAMFATRRRARQQVTVQALFAAMTKHGFNHSKGDYRFVLRTLANLGLGTIQMDSKNRVRALKSVKVTLQSIGLAATSDSSLHNFNPKPKFKKVVPQTILTPDTSSGTPPAATSTKSMVKVTFNINVEGKTVEFKVPDIPKEDLGQFIASLYPRKPRGGVK